MNSKNCHVLFGSAGGGGVMFVDSGNRHKCLGVGILLDVAVFGSEDPVLVDEYATAEVASVGLETDLPWPEEGT